MYLVVRFIDFFFIITSVVVIVLESDIAEKPPSELITLFIIQVICNIYFFLELLLRFLTCHQSEVYLKTDILSTFIYSLTIYKKISNFLVSRINQKNLFVRFIKYIIFSIIS
jgi:hypothetical protein